MRSDVYAIFGILSSPSPDLEVAIYSGLVSTNNYMYADLLPLVCMAGGFYQFI